MKKIVLATVLALSTVAFAGYNNQNHYTGGFQGGFQAQPTTVRQALSARDNSMVTLIGNITQQIGKNSYLLTDGTGEIKVEISRRIWNGLNITPQDRVKIYGKVDNELFDRVEVEVISIEKV